MATGKGPGDGTLITHANLDFVVENITIDGNEVSEVGLADLSAAAGTGRVWIAGNIVEFGTLVCDGEWDPSQGWPVPGGAATDLVLTPQAGGSPDIYTASAYLRNMGAVIPLGAKMTCSLTFRLTTVWVKS